MSSIPTNIPTPSAQQTAARAPPAKPSFNSINITTTTPRQLVDAISQQTGVNYRAIFIHCLLFDSAGSTLLIRHPDPVGSTFYPEFHHPEKLCSPAIIGEFYKFPPPDFLQGDIELTVAEWVETNLPKESFVKGTACLICALETKMRHINPLKEDDEQEYPVLVIAAGAQADPGIGGLQLSADLASGFEWVQAKHLAAGWREGCKALCGRVILEEACKQWRFRNKAFDESGAWIGRYLREGGRAGRQQNKTTGGEPSLAIEGLVGLIRFQASISPRSIRSGVFGDSIAASSALRWEREDAY